MTSGGVVIRVTLYVGGGGGPMPGDVVYRLLCPAHRTGSLIGKGGEIIKSGLADNALLLPATS